MNEERPIEKLLRRAAQKRHDEAGAPPELHPANRRLLQAEVAKQFPRAAPSVAPPSTTPKTSGLSEFIAALTQRWVYAVGILIVIGIAAAISLPVLKKSGKGMNLAKLSPEEEVLQESVPASMPTVAQSVTTVTPVEMDDAVRLNFSGGGNIKPTGSAPPPPAFTRASQELSRRQLTTDGFATVESTKLAKEDASTSLATLREDKAKPAAAPAPTTGDRNEFYSLGTSVPATEPNSVTRSYPAATAPVSFVNKSETEASTGNLNPGKSRDAVVTGGLAVDNVAPEANSDLADKDFIARGGGLETERATLNSQAFSNISAEQLARKKQAQEYRATAPAVLMNFQVQQQGRDLRIVDGDGSIYNGVVDEANTLYQQVLSQKEQQISQSYDNRARFQSPKLADTLMPATKQATDNFYLYQAQGTNRTLNRAVTFSWNFVPTNDALAAAQNDYKNNLLRSDNTKLPSQFPALLQNSFINGRAVVEDGRSIEVNAMPVKP